MSILEQARRDYADISSNTNDFGVALLFTAPNNTTASVAGLVSTISLAVDTDGNPVNSRTCRVSISEKVLTEAGYTTRSSGEANLVGHKVAFNDSTGTTKNWVITQCMPDETLGVLFLILGELS